MKIFFSALRGRIARGAIPLAACSLLATAAACEDDDGPTGLDDDVETVEFTTTGPIDLEIGSTSQLAFEIRDAGGDLIDPDDVNLTFTSSSQTIATVSTSGLITPVAPGTATITARVGTISDTITVVVGPEISSIDIVDTELDLVSDETSTFEIEVLNAAGGPVTDPNLTFTSSNNAVVTVDDDGTLTAVGPGTATITASGGGESDTFEVTVFADASGGLSAPVGSSFTVATGDAVEINDLFEVRDAGGVIIPDAELVFATTTGGIVDVDAAGELTGLAPGTTLVTVTSPDATGSSTVRLNVVDVGSLDVFQVSPATATVAVAATVDLGLGVQADGTSIQDFLGLFTTSDPTIATVHPFTGVVTGVAPGTATITVAGGGLSSESVITVQ
ncbi:MAG TPA: Ig-like domain-containing protein [Gemmatimonadota bacterium]|nr:Ig-like domain-containing protein [Gemmatimonadota bacterium]